MKIIYHPRYTDTYDLDPAAAPGRIESILKELIGKYEFIEPSSATVDDIRLVHSPSHIADIRGNAAVYEAALLAAGGAIKAAQLASGGEPSFALIRPPGHHASPESCWGFCFFNNIAVAINRLKNDHVIRNAFILDFDLHYGDGTENAYMKMQTRYYQPEINNREAFVNDIRKKLAKESNYSIMAVSAGFDRHEADWGGQLMTIDYTAIGAAAKEAALRVCEGRRFAVLEGGYNHDVLGKNVAAFLEGFS
jgi:acetoin utilization deacetylase AcuC-like enzyme